MLLHSSNLQNRHLLEAVSSEAQNRLEVIKSLNGREVSEINNIQSKSAQKIQELDILAHLSFADVIRMFDSQKTDQFVDFKDLHDIPKRNIMSILKDESFNEMHNAIRKKIQQTVSSEILPCYGEELCIDRLDEISTSELTEHITDRSDDFIDGRKHNINQSEQNTKGLEFSKKLDDLLDAYVHVLSELKENDVQKLHQLDKYLRNDLSLELPFSPREDQIAVLKDIYDFYRRGGHYGAVILPTGAGKTFTFSVLVKLLQNKKTLVLVHTKDVNKQNRDEIYKTIKAGDSLKSVGFIDGEVPKTQRHKQFEEDILVSTSGVFQNDINKYPEDVDFIVIDEADRVLTNKLIKKLKKRYPHVPILALSATTESGKRNLLNTCDLIHEIPLKQAIEMGLLTSVRALRVESETCDLSSFSNEDNWTSKYEKEVEDAIDNDYRNLEIVTAYKENTPDKIAVAICGGVDHAKNLAAMFQKQNVAAGVVLGDEAYVFDGKGNQVPIDREKLYEMLASGKIKVMTSCEVVTRGWNCPPVEVAMVATPIQSKTKYVQFIGRILRQYTNPDTGKRKGCSIIMDFRDTYGKVEPFSVHELFGITEYREMGLVAPTLSKTIEDMILNKFNEKGKPFMEKRENYNAHLEEIMNQVQQNIVKKLIDEETPQYVKNSLKNTSKGLIIHIDEAFKSLGIHVEDAITCLNRKITECVEMLRCGPAVNAEDATKLIDSLFASIVSNIDIDGLNKELNINTKRLIRSLIKNQLIQAQILEDKNQERQILVTKLIEVVNEYLLQHESKLHQMLSDLDAINMFNQTALDDILNNYIKNENLDSEHDNNEIRDLLRVFINDSLYSFREKHQKDTEKNNGMKISLSVTEIEKHEAWKFPYDREYFINHTKDDMEKFAQSAGMSVDKWQKAVSNADAILLSSVIVSSKEEISILEYISKFWTTFTNKEKISSNRKVVELMVKLAETGTLTQDDIKAVLKRKDVLCDKPHFEQNLVRDLELFAVASGLPKNELRKLNTRDIIKCKNIEISNGEIYNGLAYFRRFWAVYTDKDENYESETGNRALLTTKILALMKTLAAGQLGEFNKVDSQKRSHISATGSKQAEANNEKQYIQKTLFD